MGQLTSIQCLSSAIVVLTMSQELVILFPFVAVTCLPTWHIFTTIPQENTNQYIQRRIQDNIFLSSNASRVPSSNKKKKTIFQSDRALFFVSVQTQYIRILNTHQYHKP